MDNFIPLPEAAKRLHLPDQELHQLIRVGKIRSAMVVNTIYVAEADVMARIPREDRPEYKRFSDMDGSPIGIAEAARKYNIPQPTISRWVKKGFIRVLGRHGKQKVLINEIDVAYCAEVYRLKAGQGRWIFNSDGTPYEKLS
jgi:predicted site-specific integrase-resolvase